MGAQDSYIGQYGDALRQMQGGVLPVAQGGADIARPGALSQFHADPNRSTRNAGFLDPEQEAEKKGPDVSKIGTQIGGMFTRGSTPMAGGTDVAPASSMGVMYAAQGGPLSPGTTIVGEQGPEAVQMDQMGNANVIPNGALQGGALPGAQGGTPGFASDQKPTSWQDVHGQMSDEEKEQLADTVEERSGKPIRDAYVHAAETVGEKPKKKIDRKEMASYVAEVALRTMANMGSSDSSMEAFGKGSLQTMESRAALAQAARDKEEKQQETLRQEGREDTQAGDKRTYETSERQAKEKFDAEQKRLDRKNAVDLENMRLKAEKMNREGKNVKVAIDADGNYVIVDAEKGTGTTVTRDVTTNETKGSRGRGTSTTTTTKKEPVKAQKKTDASGVDQDTLIRQISAVKDKLMANRKLLRELKSSGLDEEEIDARVTKMAQKQVQDTNLAITGGGGNDPLGILE